MEKRDIDIYLSYFNGREDFFANQCPDYYNPVHLELTPDILNFHIKGNASFGIYVLTSQSKCNLICFDVDIPKNMLQEIEFEDENVKFGYLKNKLIRIRDYLLEKIGIDESSILIEDTGGRGYHIWVFLEEEIDGKIAVNINQIMSKDFDFEYEFFPKQASLKNKRLGSLIKLPLGLHKKYQVRSRFAVIQGEQLILLDSFEDNIAALKKTKKVPLLSITNFLQINKTKIEEIYTVEDRDNIEDAIFIPRPLYQSDMEFLFSNCTALNKLKEKCEAGIKLSFDETFTLANTLLSIENSEKFLMEMIRKSYKDDYLPQKTKREIDRIKGLYPNSCKNFIVKGICEGYCSEAIKEKDLDPLRPNTNPLTEYLRPCKSTVTIRISKTLQEEICNFDNIKNAFWRLKSYHKDEDALFFDEFDFTFFEKRLDYNIRLMSKMMEVRKLQPFVGYSKVGIPKKLNENGQMEYRKLSYASIHDLLPTQALFNIISKVFEIDFQECSYGYRAELNSNNPHIFVNWKDAYPIFRNRLFTYLREPKNKYYVCCDIEKYYDNIRHDIIIEQIKDYFSDEYVFPFLQDIINNYEYEPGSSKGLPQGPAYARILANLYLNNFDKKIQKCSSGYARYVDDFFVFFENQEDAEKGLELIARTLGELGLNLSQDIEKLAKIQKCEDDEDILRKIDSLQYGLFEEFSFIQHLDNEKIIDFYDAIEKNKIKHEEIKKINKDIPSLLYLVTENNQIEHSSKHNLILLIYELVKIKHFYPKRLKTIFYSIIMLINKEPTIDLLNFFKELEDTHKIYFLLSLYGIYKKENECFEELIQCAENGIESGNEYLQGFAVGIINYIGDPKKGIINDFSHKSTFLKTKVLMDIKYHELSKENKVLLSSDITANSTFLERQALINNIELKSFSYRDELFLSNILGGDMLLLEACEILCNIENKTSLLDFTSKKIANAVNLKELALSYVRERISEKAEFMDRQNQIQIYQEIQDEELRMDLLNVLDKFSPYDRLEKQLLFIKNKNECFYYKNKEETKFVERIPQSKLENYGFNDLKKLKSIIEDLSFGKVIPPVLNFEYNSSKKEIVVTYDLSNYVICNLEAIKINLSMSTKLQLIGGIWKKANYFFKKLKHVPEISLSNIVLDKDNNEIGAFLTIGCMLSPYYIIDTIQFKNSSINQIPQMISCLMKNIFSEEETKFEPGVNLFIDYFIGRLASRSEEYPFSFDRYNRILKRVENIGFNETYVLTKYYLLERFCSNIYRSCHTNIIWNNINNSLIKFYGNLAVILDSLDFSKLNYTNKVGKYKGLHFLSLILLNNCFNLKNLLGKQYTEDDLTTNFINMSYFAIICIEVISLIKTGTYKNNLNYIIDEEFTISAYGYSQKYDKDDQRKINELIDAFNKKTTINFDSHLSYTLKQILALYLLKNFSFDREENRFNINESKIDGSIIARLFLNDLPSIEARITKQVNLLIKTFNRDASISIEDDQEFSARMLSCIRDINKVQKERKKIKRRTGRILKSSNLPVNIKVKHHFEKRAIPSDVLYKVPLNNQYPTSEVKCSWDESEGVVHILVVPNPRVYLLYEKINKKYSLIERVCDFYLDFEKMIDIVLTFGLIIGGIGWQNRFKDDNLGIEIIAGAITFMLLKIGRYTKFYKKLRLKRLRRRDSSSNLQMESDQRFEDAKSIQ